MISRYNNTFYTPPPRKTENFTIVTYITIKNYDKIIKIRYNIMLYAYKRTYCLPILCTNTKLVFEEELDTSLYTPHIKER